MVLMLCLAYFYVDTYASFIPRRANNFSLLKISGGNHGLGMCARGVNKHADQNRAARRDHSQLGCSFNPLTASNPLHGDSQEGINDVFILTAQPDFTQMIRDAGELF